MNILLVLILLIAPLYLLVNHDKGLIKTLGPVIICYVLGIILGNIPLGFSPAISKMASEASVPLAIPLLLISTNFMAFLKSSRKTIISFVIVVCSVTIMSTLAIFVFEGKIFELEKLASMMVGVYTGGTPNMSAIGLALDVNKEAFVLLNTSDIILGAIYLLFIFTFGKKVYGAFLPASKLEDEGESQKKECGEYTSLPLSQRIKVGFGFLLLSGASLGISLALSQLIFGADNVAFIILGITSFGIAFSFNSKLNSIPGSYQVGEYLLLVFCIAIGMMANLEQILSASLIYISFCAFVMLGSIILHLFLCRLFKVSAGIAIITSVAGLFGPPFVAPVAQNLKNKSLIVPGITCGLFGYAVGNYLGLSLYYLLS